MHLYNSCCFQIKRPFAHRISRMWSSLRSLCQSIFKSLFNEEINNSSGYKEEARESHSPVKQRQLPHKEEKLCDQKETTPEIKLDESNMETENDATSGELDISSFFEDSLFTNNDSTKIEDEMPSRLLQITPDNPTEENEYCEQAGFTEDGNTSERVYKNKKEEKRNKLSEEKEISDSPPQKTSKEKESSWKQFTSEFYEVSKNIIPDSSISASFIILCV